MKSAERSKATNLMRALTTGAVTLAAIMGPGAASAAATSHNKHPKRPNAAKIEANHIKHAERVTEHRILSGQGVAFLRGDVVVQERAHDKIDPKLTHGLSINLKNPFVVFLPHPNVESGFKDIEGSGQYAVGFMDQTGDKPKITLVKYDAARMSFIPEDGNLGPTLQYAFFQPDTSGGVDLHNPMINYDGNPLHGGPLTDLAGNPESIGLAYQPVK